MNELESIDLKGIANKVYSENPKATIWNILVELLSRGEDREKYRIWILSELPIIESVARGYSGRLIQEIYNLSLRSFEKLCNYWKLEPVEEVLDFDPLEVYTEEMTPFDLEMKVSPFVIETPSIEEIEKCINNIKIYKEIIEYLNELEEE
jgi:hypothetical protein